MQSAIVVDGELGATGVLVATRHGRHGQYPLSFNSIRAVVRKCDRDLLSASANTMWGSKESEPREIRLSESSKGLIYSMCLTMPQFIWSLAHASPCVLTGQASPVWP